MSDDTPDEFEGERGQEAAADAVESTTVSSSYKVLGEFADASGAGVLGNNTASSGTPIGVEGVVPNASSGYGLSTPDDARIEGTLDTNETDFVVSAGTTNTGDAQNVIAGHVSNSVEDEAVGATIGGGGYDGDLFTSINQVYDDYGTISGGKENQAGSSDGDPSTSNGATVGGGRGNTAAGERATIAGGYANDAVGDHSVVGGGNVNDTTGTEATVAGGYDNTAGGSQSSVAGGAHNTATSGHEAGAIAGGRRNTAAGTASFVGGGWYNEAKGDYATVAGGGPSDTTDSSTQTDTRNVVHDDYGTVGGGGENRAGVSGAVTARFATVGGGENNTASGFHATVPGGDSNTASGYYSLAAGRRANAGYGGSFVWADSTDADVVSTGTDQFIVEAAGGVGLGTDSPATQLHVTESVSGSASPGNHVAIIENTSGGSSADVLSLKMAEADPLEGDNNYVTFHDGNDQSMGAIEGDGSGSVTLAGAGSDYAEYLPRLAPDEEIEAADVVGVVGDAVTRDTSEADQALVVSDRAVVTGNAPGPDAADRNGHEVCAFVGQVPVKVRGPVEDGDVIVPSGEHDGTGRAIAPEEWGPGDGPLVGRAWEASAEAGVDEVTVAVGLDTGDVVADVLADQQEHVDGLERETERLRAELGRKDQRIESLESETEQLRERLEAVESNLEMGADASATPADD